jgi:hypothetical protein
MIEQMYYLVRKVLVLTYEGPSRQHLQPLPKAINGAHFGVMTQYHILHTANNSGIN